MAETRDHRARAESTCRVKPATAPFKPRVEEWLDRVMPAGMAPLVLFRVLARDERLFEKFMQGGLLDRGNLTLRQREIIIHRTTALCRSDYEWGIHAALFATKAQLSGNQLYALAEGGADDPVWTRDEATLIRLCDELHLHCAIDDNLWRDLTETYTDEAILEMIMLAGFYHTVSYLTNGLKLPLEPRTERIPSPAKPSRP